MGLQTSFVRIRALMILQVVQRRGAEERHSMASRLQADPVLVRLYRHQPPSAERAQEQEPCQPGGRALHLRHVSLMVHHVGRLHSACMHAHLPLQVHQLVLGIQLQIRFSQSPAPLEPPQSATVLALPCAAASRTAAAPTKTASSWMWQWRQTCTTVSAALSVLGHLKGEGSGVAVCGVAAAAGQNMLLCHWACIAFALKHSAGSVPPPGFVMTAFDSAKAPPKFNMTAQLTF